MDRSTLRFIAIIFCLLGAGIWLAYDLVSDPGLQPAVDRNAPDKATGQGSNSLVSPSPEQ
jgi:hypothetical protein